MSNVKELNIPIEWKKLVDAVMELNQLNETKLKELKEQNIKLQRELNYSQDCAMKDERANREYIAELGAKNKGLMQELSNANTRLAMTRLELQEADKEITRLITDKDELRDIGRNNEATATNRLNECRAENERFANAIKAECASLKLDNQGLKSVNAKLTDQIRYMNADADGRAKAMGDMNNQIGALKKENQGLKAKVKELALTNSTLRAKVDNNELANSAVWSNRLNECRAENERFANAIRKDNKELKEQNTRLQIAANKLYEISCIIDR